MFVEIIAELANSHQGKIVNAKKIIKNFHKYGATSIKFQIYFAGDFLSNKHERFLHFKKQSFSVSEWKNLIKFTKKIGYKNIYADVLGLKAFRLAKILNISGFKVHSTDLMNDILLRELAKEKKKIFLSCGGAKIPEIFHAVEILKKNKLKPILMHGFQNYPTKIEDTNLNQIKLLQNCFGEICEYGFQDHIAGNSKYNLYLNLISLGYGIKYIEKHITLNRRAKGIDYYSSLEPQEFQNFNNIINKSSKGLSINKSGFSYNEDNYRKKTKKYWILKKKLLKNSKLKLQDLDFKRVNNNNMEPLFLNEVIGKKISQNLSKDTVISKSNFKNNICAVVVARYDSKRLPGKALLKISGQYLIEHLFLRLKKSKILNHILFCTTKKKSDNILVKLAKKHKIKCFRGDENNVLDRIIKGLTNINSNIIVRITGDDILIDTDYMNEAINYHLKNNLDYTDHKKLPSGTETEIFEKKVLEDIYKSGLDLSQTEYLTYYVTNNPSYFRIGSAPVKKKHQKKIRLTIDNIYDYKFVKPFLEKMKKNNKLLDYNMDDIISFYKNKKNNKKQLNKKNFIINTDLDSKIMSSAYE